MTKDTRLRGIEHVYTSKLFFGKYRCRVTIPFPLKIQNLKPRIEKAETSKQKRALRASLRKQKSVFVNDLFSKLDFIQSDKCTFRSGDTSVSFYCDEDTYQRFIDVETSGLISIKSASCPRAGTEEFLEHNPTKIVRDTYFFNKFKYCVVLHIHYANRAAFSEYLHNQFEIRQIDNGRRYSVNYQKKKTTDYYFGGNERIYFKDETDVFLARIAIPECIERVEEVVLTEDIKNARSITAEAY